MTFRDRVPAPGSADPYEAEAMATSTRKCVGTQHLGRHVLGGRPPLGGLGGQAFGDLVGDHHPQLGHDTNGTWGPEERPSISPGGTVMEWFSWSGGCRPPAGAAAPRRRRCRCRRDGRRRARPGAWRSRLEWGSQLLEL